MFGTKPAVSPLAFPVPDPPPHLRARKDSFPFPAMWNDPNRRTRDDGDPIPWHVPAWLPAGLEAPATFFVGAVVGVLFALCALGITSVFSSLTSRTF